MTEEATQVEEPEVQEQGQDTAGDQGDKRDLAWHLDRIWQEIKDVSKQVEEETRRGGRIARLKFEIRGQRRSLGELSSRLGSMVYEAHKGGEKRPTLRNVEGYDEIVDQIDAVRDEIALREAEIEQLRERGVSEEDAA